MTDLETAEHGVQFKKISPFDDKGISNQTGPRPDKIDEVEIARLEGLISDLQIAGTVINLGGKELERLLDILRASSNDNGEVYVKMTDTLRDMRIKAQIAVEAINDFQMIENEMRFERGKDKK
jgi:hypothetical protein